MIALVGLGTELVALAKPIYATTHSVAILIDRKRGQPFAQRNRSVTSIYVGNLSYDATEDDIRQAFAQYGEVANVNVIMDRETGRPRGFAFVEMPNGAEAKEAIENLNETEIGGRAVIVNEARPKQDRPRGGGGGRRGGGGGGRGRW
jgi:RNA recognition motif-containing protein